MRPSLPESHCACNSHPVGPHQDKQIKMSTAVQTMLLLLHIFQSCFVLFCSGRVLSCFENAKDHAAIAAHCKPLFKHFSFRLRMQKPFRLHQHLRSHVACLLSLGNLPLLSRGCLIGKLAFQGQHVASSKGTVLLKTPGHTARSQFHE